MALKSQGLAAPAPRVVAAAFLVAGGLVLSACSTASTVGDYMPTAIGGLPESAPQRPATPAAYPAVHSMPPPRSNTMLTDEEQKKLEDDLVAARNRAAATPAKPAGGAGSP